MAHLPSGTVTLWFADVEGSTRLVQVLGEQYRGVLDDVRSLLRDAVKDGGGYEIDCRADELFGCFVRATDAVAAAVALQRSCASHRWPEGVAVRVRIGIHSGRPELAGGAYVGVDVNRTARICSAGHGGQILISEPACQSVGDAWSTRDLGAYSLAGLPDSERIFQVRAPGLDEEFPPLRAELASRDTGRVRRFRRGFRSAPPTFEHGAWQVRALLPSARGELREALAELGAELFTASRALTRADGFIARIDRKRLVRRLALQQDHAVSSPLAEQRAERIAGQLACLDRLVGRRREAADLAAEASNRLGKLRDVDVLAVLRRRVSDVTQQMDEAVDQAAATLDDGAFRLTRTRSRGVYRLDDGYVVPYVDEVGVDHQRRFATLAEARTFRDSIPLIAQVASRAFADQLRDRGAGDPGAP